MATRLRLVARPDVTEGGGGGLAGGTVFALSQRSESKIHFVSGMICF